MGLPIPYSNDMKRKFEDMRSKSPMDASTPAFFLGPRVQVACKENGKEGSEEGSKGGGPYPYLRGSICGGNFCQGQAGSKEEEEGGLWYF